MYKAIQDGLIVTPEGVVRGDVIIDGEGKIAGILPGGRGNKPCEVAETIAANGGYVVPGGVDGHVHFGGFGPIPIADDFYSGSRAALAGGTTTVVDFCESLPGEEPLACIARRKKAGADAMVDYALHYTFTKNYRAELPLIDKIAEEGITAFKAYTYYDNTALSPADFREVLCGLGNRGVLLVHAEEKTIIDREKARAAGAGKENMRNLALTRPRVTEQIAVETVLALARESGTRICIAHTSAGETADIRKREREAGNDRFMLETCPHYLHLTEDKLEGARGALFTMNPPLRTKADNERLWRAVLEGDIAMLSTDHCPFLSRHKFGHDFLTVPCGVDGVQARLLYLFSEGVVKRNLPLTEFVNIASANAAKFYGLYPRKGVIQKGSDADLVIINPAAPWTWNAGAIAGATDYTVLEGVEFQGTISRVIKGGNTVVEEGRVVAEKGTGRFLPQGSID